jgi:hypothetical protein
VTGTRPTYALDKYVGTYVDSAYGTIDVALTNGALQARWDKADLGPLEHWEYDVFRSRPSSTGGNGTALTFIPDGAGGISAVRAFGNTFTRSRGRAANQ